MASNSTSALPKAPAKPHAAVAGPKIGTPATASAVTDAHLDDTVVRPREQKASSAPTGSHPAAARKSTARKASADPYGILKAAAGGADSSAAAAPTDIAALLEASSSWAHSDVGSAGYSPLLEMLKSSSEGGDPKDDETEEQCPKCGGRMHTLEHEYQCSSCTFVVERDTTLSDPADDDAPARRQPQTGRLRIVGPNSGHYQPDLDRSSSTNYAATQRKQIYEEYLMYRQRRIDAGEPTYPLNVLELAADIYHEIQRQVTKRSQSKKAIMASCLKIACVQKGFAPNTAELARFMGLATKGTARGENFIRKMKADGHISVDVNKDTCNPHIVTTFALLNMDGSDAAQLQTVVESVVKKSISDTIGVSSVIRSKAMGATYVVLRRAAIASGTKAVTLSEFCQKCQIRKNTVDRFVDQLTAYHSHFEDIYKAAGIFTGVLTS